MQSGAENISQIVALPRAKGLDVVAQVLVEGDDFYACARVSPDGTRLAWLQWQHPNMPWDQTALVCAELRFKDGGFEVSATKKIAGGVDRSISQADFLSDNRLLFTLEDGRDDISEGSPKNFSNLYREGTNGYTSITQDQAEYGDAHWIFGQSRWVQIDRDSILAIKTQGGYDQLELINLDKRTPTTVIERVSHLSQLSFSAGAALAMANYRDQPESIIKIKHEQKVIQQRRSASWIKPREVSPVEVIAFPTRDGEQAYANYYASQTVDAETSLLVLVHGGPTSRAVTALSPLIQFFCQNNFSILDVNHRGSTGRGRAFRQRLLGQWGEIDANDIADAVATIGRMHKLDTSRVFIRGGSAGGYAVLRALTRFPDLFCGGACYYGIGNLITLAEITHKFEGKYTDQLIGEPYDASTASLVTSRYRSRSPIFDIDEIKSPLILFQGLEDKIVPPEVSREMVHTLKQNGVRHEYIEYAGEGHGFRQAQTRIDALEREIAFYRNVLAS